MCEHRWIQFELQNSPSRVFAFDGKIYMVWQRNTTADVATLPFLANLWNRITTKIFDIFRILTLKQQKFSQSDPVLIHRFSKKIAVRSSPDPAKVGFSPDLCSSLESTPALPLRDHLWCSPPELPDRNKKLSPNLLQKIAKLRKNWSNFWKCLHLYQSIHFFTGKQSFKASFSFALQTAKKLSFEHFANFSKSSVSSTCKYIW